MNKKKYNIRTGLQILVSSHAPLNIARAKCMIALHKYTQPTKWRYSGESGFPAMIVNIVLLKTVIGPG